MHSMLMGGGGGVFLSWGDLLTVLYFLGGGDILGGLVDGSLFPGGES